MPFSFFRRLCCWCCPSADDEFPNSPTHSTQTSETDLSSSTPPRVNSVLIQIDKTNGRHRDIDNDLQSSDTELVEIHSMASSSNPNSDFSPPRLRSHPHLSSSQHCRALELLRWSSLEIGWQVLVDKNPNSSNQRKLFYFNTFTGRTVWHPPPEIQNRRTWENQQTDLLIPGSLEWISEIVKYMKEEFDIQLTLWSNSRVNPTRALFRPHRIDGRRPNLLHLLFYSHVLRNEFQLYPPSYLRSIGLRRIVLADELRYDGQSRAAIPLVEFGTLLLEPKLQEIIYVTSVLHHELFHIVDCVMIQRAIEQKQMQLKQQHQSSHEKVDGDESNFSFHQALHKADPFDFATPLPSSSLTFAPSSRQLTAAADLHGAVDLVWDRLNPPGFQYGAGGSNERGHDMFLSHGRTNGTIQRREGFLNGYCQTAVEEDKAEVYAALMRDGTLLDSRDPILRSKAHELKRRLEWFCEEMREGRMVEGGTIAADGQSSNNFWHKLRHHTPHPSRPSTLVIPSSSSATLIPTPTPTPSTIETGVSIVSMSDWIERRDHVGNTYFFNRVTQQTSWIKPTQVASVLLPITAIT